MTAYVEQLRRREKRINRQERTLQIVRLLLANDQAHRRRLRSHLPVASGVVVLGVFHACFLLPPVWAALRSGGRSYPSSLEASHLPRRRSVGWLMLSLSTATFELRA